MIHDVGLYAYETRLMIQDLRESINDSHIIDTSQFVTYEALSDPDNPINSIQCTNMDVLETIYAPNDLYITAELNDKNINIIGKEISIGHSTAPYEIINTVFKENEIKVTKGVTVTIDDLQTSTGDKYITFNEAGSGIDLSGYAKLSDLNAYVLKADAEEFVTNNDLINFVEKDELGIYALKTEVPNINNLIQKEEVDLETTKINLEKGNFLASTDEYVKINQLKIENSRLSMVDNSSNPVEMIIDSQVKVNSLITSEGKRYVNEDDLSNCVSKETDEHNVTTIKLNDWQNIIAGNDGAIKIKVGNNKNYYLNQFGRVKFISDAYEPQDIFIDSYIIVPNLFSQEGTRYATKDDLRNFITNDYMLDTFVSYYRLPNETEISLDHRNKLISQKKNIQFFDGLFKFIFDFEEQLLKTQIYDSGTWKNCFTFIPFLQVQELTDHNQNKFITEVDVQNCMKKIVEENKAVIPLSDNQSIEITQDAIQFIMNSNCVLGFDENLIYYIKDGVKYGVLTDKQDEYVLRRKITEYDESVVDFGATNLKVDSSNVKYEFLGSGSVYEFSHDGTIYFRNADDAVSKTFVTSDELDDYLTINGYVTEMEQYFDKDQIVKVLNDYVRKDELLSLVPLNDYATLDELSKYMLKSDIPTSENLDNYVQKTELEEYAKKNEVSSNEVLEEYVKIIDLPDFDQFVTQDQLPDLKNYVTNTYLEENYVSDVELLNHLSNYLLENELESNLTSYVKRTELDQYAAKVELENYSTTSDADKKYATKEELPDLTNYAQKSELPNMTEYIKTADADEKYALKSETGGGGFDVDGYLNYKYPIHDPNVSVNVLNAVFENNFIKFYVKKSNVNMKGLIRYKCTRGDVEEDHYIEYNLTRMLIYIDGTGTWYRHEKGTENIYFATEKFNEVNCLVVQIPEGNISNVNVTDFRSKFINESFPAL